jgi:hypothetical protein
MKKFLKNLFTSEDKEGSQSEPSLRDQIASELEKCKKDRALEYQKIDDIKKWGKDLILEIFDVPTAYWYDELKEYENIKFHEKNLNISERLIEKTDKVVEEYREQLKLSQSKIDFCSSLIKKYENFLDRLDKAHKDIERLKKEEGHLNLLNQHKKRLAKMRSETADFGNMFENTGKLELLNEDIQKIEEDFNIKKEVSEYIDNLDKDFANDLDNTDSSVLRDEIHKFIEQLEK